VRGNFTWARSEGRDRTSTLISGIQGFKFNRFLYDGDVQLRYPFRGGVAPYVFAGGGGITTRRPESFTASSFTDRSFTKGAGNTSAPRWHARCSSSRGTGASTRDGPQGSAPARDAGGS